MTSPAEMEQLRGEVAYYQDRVALLRAKLYRWGLRSNSHLQALERQLARAQQRLHDAGIHQGSVR